MKRCTPSPRQVALLATVLLASGPALAFVPTEAEWAGWPEYCRVRYTVSGSGRDSAFVSRVATGEVDRWKARLGPAWYALHHHCYGLAHLERARLAQDPAKRRYELDVAIREQQFALNRTPSENPMYAEMSNQKGLALRQKGDIAAALDAFDASIKAHPTLPAGYQGKALVYRDQKRFGDARSILEEGDTRTGGGSAEINYFLGLVLVDLKDYAGAREYARKAYTLGYPLPGLRDKLARAGYPLD
jgi:tetratricopeptide (TPR) repeat protein